MTDIIAWAFSGLFIILTVSLHYEMMLMVSDRLVPWAQKHLHGRRVVAISVLALILAHIFAIWLFALGYMVALHFPIFGSMTGDFDGSFNSLLYVSSSQYTSLGASDIQILGALRALASAETLTGLVMITWSASFTYLKMEQIWQHHRK